MANNNELDTIKESLLMIYQVLDRELQVKLCLQALDLLEEQTKQRKKEERDREFKRQLKAAIRAAEYTC